MLTKSLRLPLLVVLIAFSFNIHAQELFSKFGDISKSDLDISECTFDPGASALVLYDYGEGSFNFTYSKGWYYKLKCHKRIKILNKKGLDEANFSLTYYAGKSGHFESVRELEGASYNLENGEIVKQVVKGKSNTFVTDLGNGYEEIKMAIPAVKEGSVIEYSYELIREDITTIRSWYFQSNNPVLCSHFRIEIPEDLYFQTNLLGNRGLDTSFTTSKLGDNWVMYNIPAAFDEPYAASPKDFSSHMEFQLIQVKMENNVIKDIVTNYPTFNNTLLESKLFDDAMRPKGHIKKLVSSVVSGLTEPEAKARAILQHLQKNVSWNGYAGLYPDDSPKDLFEEGKGDASSINQALIACFRAAGLKAEPIILSTRKHGRPHPVYPKLDKFNYVVAALDIDGKTLLADATDPDLPLGYVSIHCLNADGWRVSKDHYGWVPMQAGASANHSVLVELSPSNDKWTGKVSFSSKDYAAIDGFESLRKDEKEYLSELTKALDKWHPTEQKIVSEDRDAPQIQIEAQISGDLLLEDQIYLEPVYTGLFSSNPFSGNDRNSPIDFPYLLNLNYVLRIEIPQGYEVSEMPQNVALEFGEDKGLVYKYRSTQQGNVLMIISSLRMNRGFYLADEYADLRQFFDHIVSKNQELVVLTKS
ncbi:MAG: DUF3857 domain-containing protein [Saprospiraceae bacterium]|nr:DUF3857 domain-containing protein [Saprospiraceae bacterium]